MKFQGYCHCRAVQFEADLPLPLRALRCNCSICTMSGFLHLIVPKSKFAITEGEDQLTTYRFNSKVAQHTFCKTCGIKPFYVPRFNPDGISVNANCLDVQFTDIEIDDFDGQNWEDNARELTHLSMDQ